jgi:predicted DCC family thiol-disulfide oxidoreductase YuxK
MSQSSFASPHKFEVEVFFDGDCPLCRREIALLRHWDRQARIRFTDIAREDFDAAEIGIPWERLMAEIHGRLPDGSVITGVEVFRRLYGAVGFRLLVAISRWPGIAWLLTVAYRLFARNRLKLTGRCSAATCQIDTVSAPLENNLGSNSAANG